MPLRALGYVTSALSVASECLPNAQIQMVHTVHTAERVNGLDPREPLAQARRLAEMSRRAVEQARDVTHLVDPKHVSTIDEDAIATALEGLPEHAARKLERAGTGKGRTLSYVAGHLLMHDTLVELQLLSSDEADPITPTTVISIGAQSERPFYLARMACRDAGVALPNPVDSTGQLFTRHILPPYFMCREGEPHINMLDRTYPLRHPFERGYDPLNPAENANPSVQRDLEYLSGYLHTKEDPGPGNFHDLIANMQHPQGERNA